MDPCHICGLPSTGRDHIPPKCLFPPGTAGQVTFPACDIHNSRKSKDDEYLRDLFAGSLPPAGHSSFPDLIDRSKRARQRKESVRYSTYLDSQISTDHHFDELGFYSHSSQSVEFDMKRIETVLSPMVHAVIRYEYNKAIDSIARIDHRIVLPNKHSPPDLPYRLIDKVKFDKFGCFGCDKHFYYLALFGSESNSHGAVMSVFYQNFVFFSAIRPYMAPA